MADQVQSTGEVQSSGGGTWGSITGTLSSQTDLQTALNLNAPLASPTFTGTMVIPVMNESKGTDIPSATSTPIGAATGNYVDVTGTVTITSFDTVQAGTRRIVNFTGILTLTYNATSLILPTAANIVTAVGDVATFISLGSGNWKCIEYTSSSQQTYTTGTWVPAWTGFSADPTAVTARYILIGKQCTVWLFSTAGTSNATTTTVTLPFAAANIANQAGMTFPKNNGAFLTSPGRIYTTASSNIGTLDKDIAGGAWTNPGGKGVVFNFTYEIA